jgi:hypothetical protein
MIYLFFILIFIGCNSNQKLESGSGLHYIKNLDFKIKDLKNIEWKVGRKRQHLVSQGVFFELEIPKLESKMSSILTQKYGIDSWIYKIEKQTRKGSQVIGFVQYHFKNFTGNIKSFSTKVLYHSASVSLDFRRFHCPAFNHRYLIKDLELKESQDRNKALYTTSEDLIRRRVSQPSFSITSFSGGVTLRGKITADIAFYNSNTKKVYGDFVSSNNFISIGEEEKVSIPSCIGIKEEEVPLPESRSPGLRDLEIKR